MKLNLLFVGLARTIYLRLRCAGIRYFRQGNHQIYGHIRCIYTVLANPDYLQLVGYSTQYQSGHFLNAVRGIVTPCKCVSVVARVTLRVA
jgi:hypothetical protein